MRRPTKDMPATNACRLHCKEVGTLGKGTDPVYLRLSCGHKKKKHSWLWASSSGSIFTIEIFSFPNNTSIGCMTLVVAWGCEALVNRDTPDKLETTDLVKCSIHRYPKENDGWEEILAHNLELNVIAMLDSRLIEIEALKFSDMEYVFRSIEAQRLEELQAKYHHCKCLLQNLNT
ncbi:hypothetical protein Tco_1408917 [Tanacetum coccineum]